MQGVELGPAEIVTKFVRLALGGPLVGILFAMVASWWLSWIFNDGEDAPPTPNPPVLADGELL